MQKIPLALFCNLWTKGKIFIVKKHEFGQQWFLQEKK